MKTIQTPFSCFSLPSQPVVEIPIAKPVMSIPPLVVHVAPYVEEPVFHADQSEIVGVYERMDEFQD